MSTFFDIIMQDSLWKRFCMFREKGPSHSDRSSDSEKACRHKCKRRGSVCRTRKVETKDGGISRYYRMYY